MSYDESVDIEIAKSKPKIRKYVRQAKKSRMTFHVCIPLYKGIPKELQTGWSRMGSHGILEWNNTTDISNWKVKDKGFYCGTCGRRMVKGKSEIVDPKEDVKVIKLL